MFVDIRKLTRPQVKEILEAAHIDQLAAENEALRAEVERLTFEMGCLQQQYDERTACMIVYRGQALACSDAVRTAYSDERRRADKLAKALRLIESAKDRGFGIDYARG